MGWFDGIKDDELYNLLNLPLQVGVQLTVLVDEEHGEPPLRMNYMYELSGDRRIDQSWPVIQRKPRSFIRELFSPRSTVTTKNSDLKARAAGHLKHFEHGKSGSVARVHVWYVSLKKR